MGFDMEKTRIVFANVVIVPPRTLFHFESIQINIIGLFNLSGTGGAYVEKILTNPG